MLFDDADHLRDLTADWIRATFKELAEECPELREIVATLAFRKLPWWKRILRCWR
jgi:hypothetical protein